MYLVPSTLYFDVQTKAIWASWEVSSYPTKHKAPSTKLFMDDLKHLIFLLIGILIAFTVVMTMVAYTVLAERRILGFIQGRLGPNRVGPGGFLQPIADLIKFIFKEDIVPDKSTRFVYFLAPVIATTAALMTIVVYP